MLVPFASDKAVPLMPPLEALVFSSFVSRVTTKRDCANCNVYRT